MVEVKADTVCKMLSAKQTKNYALIGQYMEGLGGECMHVKCRDCSFSVVVPESDNFQDRIPALEEIAKHLKAFPGHQVFRVPSPGLFTESIMEAKTEYRDGNLALDTPIIVLSEALLIRQKLLDKCPVPYQKIVTHDIDEEAKDSLCDWLELIFGETKV
jgi:hypothetical protein